MAFQNLKEKVEIQIILTWRSPAEHDIPETNSEGPLMVLMSGISRRHSGDSQGTNTKTDDLMKKRLLEAMFLVLHIYYCFLQEKQILKSSKRERPRDNCKTQLRDIPGTK